MAKLELTSVVKTYPNGHEAAKGVNVTIEDGEFAVFVGPSGCGKSTLLRMIAGLETVTDGEIRLGDRVINTLEPADRDIAMVFQNYALYPHMTVRKNLAYGLINRRFSKEEIEKRVQEAARLLQLEEYLDRRPQQLSGGQRQRVAMGRAIVREPEAFLFDEPLSNLDAKLRTQMRLEIKRLQKRLGVTAVYVTHDQVEAMTMADRIVVLNHGRIEQVGTPHEVYHKPASLFVASFIGSPSMNLMDVSVGNGQALFGEGLMVPLSQTVSQSEVKLGVRPERLSLEAAGTTAEGRVSLPFSVNLVEELGANRLIYGQIGEHSVTVSQNSDLPLPSGEAVVLFDPADIHLFDSQSGNRI
ncbi:ABC transporter ATP-binding protein [Kiloniella sp. b19]|uniref:ABC transporter ATP-binding protein n=1 Tax=Kiloniella sp. GXU_MW_B19 TaxID=3141326 RepID=UPI0031DBA5BC